MQDRQVFEQILGITSPWFVSQVELALKEGEVRVALAHRPDAVWRCPDCGQVCPLHDHQEERRWRHLDTCQYRTVMSASLPRTNCAEHGVKLVRVPWAESRRAGIHAAVRGIGDRVAGRGQPKRGGRAVRPELGRGAWDHGPGGEAWAGAA